MMIENNGGNETFVSSELNKTESEISFEINGSSFVNYPLNDGNQMDQDFQFGTRLHRSESQMSIEEDLIKEREKAAAQPVSHIQKHSLKILYLWLAGTLEEYRQFHLMRRLITVLKKYATDNGFNVIALKTERVNFPVMHDWCSRGNWKQVEVNEIQTLFYQFV